MSKMDDLRAMREARFERAAARAAQSAARPKKTERPPPKAAEASRPPADLGDPESPLCGHRAISGRTCTREHGHAAKSHRYS
jgi:hypothetical protein